jgi:hypothetical protein
MPNDERKPKVETRRANRLWRWDLEAQAHKKWLAAGWFGLYF